MTDINMTMALSDEDVQDILIALHDSIERENRLMETEDYQRFAVQSAKYVERLEALKARIRKHMREC